MECCEQTMADSRRRTGRRHALPPKAMLLTWLAVLRRALVDAEFLRGSEATPYIDPGSNSPRILVVLTTYSKRTPFVKSYKEAMAEHGAKVGETTLACDSRPRILSIIMGTVQTAEDGLVGSVPVH